jgi:glycosyltransferase involved in cell wall biosynthesis
MNTKITLSYILTTFNKLPYLKLVLDDLLQNIQVDEEIIITDGGSTDGTKEYIGDLFKTGKIHKFISEKDKGEAHGFNKAILMASGELIKIITDDDAFHYPSIKMCKEYMLKNTQYDFLGGNTGNNHVGSNHPITWAEEFEADYLLWKENKLNNFFFNGTCLMLRKSSLALIGLFNTSVLLVDMEYTLRNTSVAKMAWCKSIVSIRILNEQSNNLKFVQRSNDEDKKLSNLFNYKHRNQRVEEELNKQPFYKKVKRKIFSFVKRINNHNSMNTSIPNKEILFNHVYEKSKKWLYSHEKNKSIEFI